MKEISNIKTFLEHFAKELKAYGIITNDAGSVSLCKDGFVYIAYQDEIFTIELASTMESQVPFYELHKLLYSSLPSTGCIIHAVSSWVLSSSIAGNNVPAMLDDSAQIVGVSTKVFSHLTANKLLYKVRGRSAVLLKDSGALCFSSDSNDALAVCRILEKNCQCFITAKILRGKKLKYFEALRLRQLYKNSYSKESGLISQF